MDGNMEGNRWTGNGGMGEVNEGTGFGWPTPQEGNGGMRGRSLWNGTMDAHANGSWTKWMEPLDGLIDRQSGG